jgi:hypothetical protein
MLIINKNNREYEVVFTPISGFLVDFRDVELDVWIEREDPLAQYLSNLIWVNGIERTCYVRTE